MQNSLSLRSSGVTQPGGSRMKAMLRAQPLALAGLALWVAGLVAAGSASAATLTVCANGCQYTTITAALAAASDGDEIVIGPGTYVERLTIAADVSLSGAGATRTTINGPPPSGELNFEPVVKVESGVSAAIGGVTITGGDTEGSGGGVANDGMLTLTRSAVVANHAIFSGGSIANVGTLAISASTISGLAGHGNGGGISNSGALTISNSTVSGRSADCCGGAIFNAGTATLVNSSVVDSSSYLLGGGIVNSSTGEMMLSHTAVTDNAATGAGSVGGGGVYNDGALSLEHARVSDNTAGSEGRGGGIFNNGTLTLGHSKVTDNTAAVEGGGIYNSSEGSLSLDKSQVKDNTPDDCVGC
jgi:hypothetical protein